MVDIYTQKPVQVEVVRFNGWQTKGGLESLMKWLNVFEPFYVPEGYDHGLRTDSERDRSRGDIRQGTYGFLVLTLHGRRTRINSGSWLVKNSQGFLTVLNEQDFKKDYTEYVQPEENK